VDDDFGDDRQSWPEALPGMLAWQPCPAALPGSLARQPCPAALPGSLARQPCPAALPDSHARQPCPAALLARFLLWSSRQMLFKIYYRVEKNEESDITAILAFNKTTTECNNQCNVCIFL
jgi:hypothetical protein